jgi:hypothetical protein
VRPQHSGCTRTFSAHAADPRLDGEQVDVGNRYLPPSRRNVHSPSRFEHPVMGRGGGLPFAGQPAGRQFLNRDPPQRRGDVLTFGFRDLYSGGEQLGVTLCLEATLLCRLVGRVR